MVVVDVVVDITWHINDSCTRDYHIARERALTRAPYLFPSFSLSLSLTLSLSLHLEEGGGRKGDDGARGSGLEREKRERAVVHETGRTEPPLFFLLLLPSFSGTHYIRYPRMTRQMSISRALLFYPSNARRGGPRFLTRVLLSDRDTTLFFDTLTRTLSATDDLACCCFFFFFLFAMQQQQRIRSAVLRQPISCSGEEGGGGRRC